MASSSGKLYPLCSLEQMLAEKTTLRTQKVTHRNIICIGAELLKEIESFMNSDKDAAVRKAVLEAEAKLLHERQKVIDEIVEQLARDNNDVLEKERKRAEKEIEAVKYRCEVAEKKRSRIAQQKFHKEKEEALRKARKEAAKMTEEAVKLAKEELRATLSLEHEQNMQKAVQETRYRMEKEADMRIAEAVASTQELCEKTATAHLNRVKNEHRIEVEALNARLEQLTSSLEKEKSEKEEYQDSFVELKEDYKRFQNYTQGFCSDYLLK